MEWLLLIGFFAFFVLFGENDSNSYSNKCKRDERENLRHISEHERERAYHNECLEKAANGDESAIAYFQMVSGRSRDDVIARAKNAVRGI